MPAPATTLPLAKPGEVHSVGHWRVVNCRLRFYRPELDLLRFIAFLAVFFHHSLPAFNPAHFRGFSLRVVQFETFAGQAGGFGVCLFFLLSAYLITEILQREASSKGIVNVSSFYKRRILRIWPLYFCFVAMAAILGIVHPTWRVEPGRIFAFALLSGNWYVSKLGCGSSPIAPLWSISVEEQFYLAWPWIAKAGRRCLLLTCASILPISWTVIYLVSRSSANPGRTLWVNSFVQFQFFAIGSALAIFLGGRAPQFGNKARVAIIFSGLLFWFVSSGACHLKDDGPTLTFLPAFLGYSLVALGCVLLFLGFLGAPIATSSPFVYLGKISYGLYVFHLMAIEFSRNVFASPHAGMNPALIVFKLLLGEVIPLVFTIVLAAASYHVLEAPFLRLKERSGVIRSRPI